MSFDVSIPTDGAPFTVRIEPGESAIFVGANGGGKTRLAVQIESSFGLKAHRISAHRALSLNPSVAKIGEAAALSGLRTGNARGGERSHRESHRWSNRSATKLLDDFDFLVQALFAEQANKSLETHRKARSGTLKAAEPTKFEQLAQIWERLLPHRHLQISGDDIQVALPGGSELYAASDMSDGERAIFYMIGQALVAAPDSLLIVDEPELHVHRSIVAKLWDELEGARQDCAFIFITHDLEFAASRVAQKFSIQDYKPTPAWMISRVPEGSGFDEHLTTLILGSRRPVLFVEGTDDSLDFAIYRCCYPEWTVVSRGSCEEVIHSVVTMRRNADLTRITCSGIVDADHYEPEEIERLTSLGVAVLPVAEIENLILLPAISRAIAEAEGYSGAELEACLDALKAEVFSLVEATGAVEAVAARYCRRRIDRLMKTIDLSAAKTVVDIDAECTARLKALDVLALGEVAKKRIEDAKKSKDLVQLLAQYDNKGLLALAGRHLRRTKLVDFEGWLTRVLRNDKAPKLVAAVKSSLPAISPE
jgi:ABC-type lipoprotein export system ATPase subunit